MSNPKPLDDNEMEMRSVLMRLYHSRMEGEAAYPARFVNGAAPGLEAKGWIERRDDGWRMTEAGVVAWAKLSSAVINNKWRNANFNEIFWSVGKPIRRRVLTPTATRMMKGIAQAGGKLPVETVAAMGEWNHERVDGLPLLMKCAYVISDGRDAWLSGPGRMVAQEKGWLTEQAHEESE